MIGIQLKVPDGWMNLRKGITYYLLKSDPIKKIVYLVMYFRNKKEEYRAELIQMDRFFFEEGLKANAIQQSENQQTLPPWLAKFEGVDFLTVKNGRIKANFESRVNEKVEIIQEAVNCFETILNGDDPRKTIHQYARDAKTTQNESRFRTNLLTYLLFGRNKWALVPNYTGVVGVKDEKSTKKQGSPPIADGKNFGFKMSAVMREKCQQGFLKYAENTKFLNQIYIEVLRKSFGCKVFETDNGLQIVCFEPYPTFNQFKYVIDKIFGTEQRQKILYGEVRFRNKKAPSKGRFSQEISNLYEKVYVDAYQVAARPKGILHNSVLPAIYGVTGADALSGVPLGIGFSFGSEDSTGYRMLLFSMAVDKKKFCKLFNIEIESHEWPSVGLPAHCLLDRGAGAKGDLIADFTSKFVIRQISKSWSGQSKAPVETIHPKQSKMEGQPTYQAADLSPYEIAVAEILRILEYIKTTNAQDRLDPDADLVDVYPTPVGIFNHYNRLYRNDAIQISFEEAVRTFLTKVQFTVKEDAIYLHGRMFNCDALRETGVFILGETKIEGYILDLCVRYVWVEWRGRLIEVTALHRIRGDEKNLFTSYPELEQSNTAASEKRSELNANNVAEKVRTKQRFEETTGKDYDESIKRRRGKVPKNSTSEQEASEVFSSKNFKKYGAG